MTVVFYTGLIFDDVYRLVVSRFEDSKYATAAFSLVRRKALTEGEIDIIRAFSDCGVAERQIAIKINKFKIVVHNFLYDPMNYVRNKRREHLSKFSAHSKRNVIRMVVQDCVYSSAIKYALELPVGSFHTK